MSIIYACASVLLFAFYKVLRRPIYTYMYASEWRGEISENDLWNLTLTHVYI